MAHSAAKDVVVEYNISRYKPELQMDPARVTVLIGRSGSGKSMIARDLLYRLARKSHVGLVMSATEQLNGFYSKIVPPCLIYTEFRPDKIYDLLDVQARKRKAREGLEADIQTMIRLGRNEDVVRLRAQLAERIQTDRAFIVLDDLAFSAATFKSECMRLLLLQGRHYNVSCVISCQYLMILPTAIRANIAVVFSASESIHSNRIKMYTHLFGIFPNLNSFERVFSACTQNYSFAVMDNTIRTNEVEKCVFWYEADINLPPFKLCAAKWWTLNDIWYDPDHEDRLRKKRQLEFNGISVKKCR